MNQQEEVNMYWSLIVENFILGDLKRMVGFTPKPEAKSGNLNFAITLVLFASIELLGSFYSGKSEGGENEGKNFMQYYFSAQYKDSKLLKELWDKFRHGLAHAMVPKMGSAVSRRMPNQHLRRISYGLFETLVLDADSLFIDFEKALQDYKKDLDLDKKTEKGDSLRGNFVATLEKMRVSQQQGRSSVGSSNVPSSLSSSSYTTYDPMLNKGMKSSDAE